MKTRRYTFRAHFNRINMQRGNPNVWTVHMRNTCYQVASIEFQCPVRTLYKADGRQPRAVLVGKAYLHISGDTAILRA